MKLVRKAVEFGWTRARIEEIAIFARNHNRPVQQVELEQMVLAGGWIVYRDQDFRALHRAWDDRKNFPHGVVTVWGDGSGTTFDQPAGIGVVIEKSWLGTGGWITISENIGPGTNNRAELMAVWRGLKEVPDCERQILVRTDSEWTIGACTQNWSIQKNVELVKAIRKDISLRHGNVTFKHVKGHAGIEQNELCDRLARAGRLQQLPD